MIFDCNSNLITRIVVSTLVIVIPACFHTARAQQPLEIHRIGILLPNPPSLNSMLLQAFRQGLEENGYVEGQNIDIEYRFGDGKSDRYPDLAADLVRRKVDVIVTSSTRAIKAVKNATSTIPIVMAAAADPVGTGLVASLAHPGGNVTGLSMRSPDLSGKRLQLLKEVAPRVRHVSILWNPANEGNAVTWQDTQTVAQSMALKLQSIEVRTPGDFGRGFKVLTKARADAFAVLRDPLVNNMTDDLVQFAAKNHLPAIYESKEIVLAGGLMSYAPNHADLYRRAAYFVRRILTGTRPAELPVERPMRVEFVINLKAAREIGLTIPADVLQRADSVIK
jgi:putative tryptophan/tyrosine transport system substrate-binding protein